ncbi:MAG: glycosyl hydrolase family 18 protein [Bacteroides sp.]|nr:glycosyl hydrolase family 18 protein [Bacteroides sp.]
MKQILLVCGLVFIAATSFCQTARIVGYLPTYRFSSSNQIEYCRLTHLNLAFANPDSAGNIEMPDISSVISDALNDNPGINICISLAGAGLSAEQTENWSNLIDIPSNRPAFIAKIVDYVLLNHLDGVDVDLEWEHVTSGYSGFVTELDSALDRHNKIITAAFPNQTLFSAVSDDALDAFDFINIMSYDATGPWNPSSPGQHSSYSYAVNGINFWKNNVGISGDKLTLGLPFYGYDFVSSSTVNAVTYASMVAMDVSYADIDNVGTAYYNGRPSIEAKVNLADNEVGGVMIWELGQDSFDEYSLLRSLHNKYTSLGIFTSGLCGNEGTFSLSDNVLSEDYTIYPNPCSDYFTLRQGYSENTSVVISNLLGQIIDLEARPGTSDELYFDIEGLVSGLYIITVFKEGQIPQTYKLIKSP